MHNSLETLFTPDDFAALASRDLSGSICVVFDVFRATTTIVTALANGASGVIPVADIPEALAWKQREPAVLLAGERDGVRIRANLTGGTEFDLGNSPREFIAPQIAGKTIVLSTTNGSRALRACANASEVLACSFANLQATADYLRARPGSHLLLVCSGTGNQAAYEDVLGAGALADLLASDTWEIADSAAISRQIYLEAKGNLIGAAQHSRNGRRLLSMPDLRDDVPICLEANQFSLVAKLEERTIIRKMAS